MRKRVLSVLLAVVLMFGCLPAAISTAAEEEKPTKVVVSVEGQTIGHGFYVEPTIVTFEEFEEYWKQKGEQVTAENITAGGMLSYALTQNGTPMDCPESSSGPAYLATVLGVDRPGAVLPQFLADAGVKLRAYDGDTALSEKEYTASAGWMYTVGNWMSDQAMGGHKLYQQDSPDKGKSDEQDGERYYVVRLQYTVDGLGSDIGFDRSGMAPYSYEAADKGQLYILYAKLKESGFFEQNPKAKEDALAVMNTLNATQEEVDAAYAALKEACHAEMPVFKTDLSEEPVSYRTGEAAAPLMVDATVSSGELSYEWFSSMNKTDWVSLGVTEKSYQPSTEKSGTIYYKCVVTNYDNTTGLSNQAESHVATVITGTETPVFVTDLSEQEVSYLTVDKAEALHVETQVSGEGVLTYQWYESADKKDWTELPNADSAEYVPQTEKIGTTYYKCTVTNTQNGEQSAADSKVAMITVKADTPVFETNLRTMTYYPKFDEQFALSVKATVKDQGKLTYQWYRGETLGADGTVDGMTPIEGATADTYQVDTSKAGAWYFKVVVTNELQGQAVSATSAWSRVELKADTPEFEKNLDGEDIYYLVGEKEPKPLEVEAVTDDGGSITYQWYESSEEPWGIYDMEPIEGATENAFTPDTKTGHTTYYACRATNTLRGVTATADSEIVKVVVSCEKPVLLKNLEEKVSYKAGETAEPLVVEAEVHDGGTLSYQWYRSEREYWVPGIDVMEPIEGATENSYVPELSKSGVKYACRVTNTKDGNSVSTDSIIAEIEVTCDAPVFIKDLDTKGITYNQNEKAEPLVVEAEAHDGGTLSYQWYNRDGKIEGATEPSYTPDTKEAGSKEYWVTVTNTKAGITNTADSSHATVTVKAKQQEITNEEELRAIQPNGNYLLTEDIVLTEEWEPIQKFAGIFDGNGHTISNVIINQKSNGAVGFFAEAGNGAVIQNLGLKGTITQTGYGQAGGLVGQTFDNGLMISNCYVRAEVNAPEWYHVGGLIGQMGHSGTIEHSYFIGTLTGGNTDYSFSGGLVGQTYHDQAVIRDSYTTWEKAVGDYAKYDAVNSKNNYCQTEKDAHAEKIPEDMEAFVNGLNKDGEKYISDGQQINDGYPILLWQKKEAPEYPDAPEPEEAYWGDRTEAKVYDDFENDLWLQYQQKEMQPGEVATLRPWRMEQIISDSISNDVQRPVFHFEIIAGDSISLDTDSSSEKAVVTAEKPGTSVVKVTYDALEYKGKTWGASSPVNTAYAVFTVGETGKAEITCSEELQNWRHYDTIYYKDGETVPYTFDVSADGAESIKVTLNGEEIQGNGGTYTANLENRSNIIGILAKDKDGKLKSLYRVVDARFIEVNVSNKTNPEKSLQPGDTANISFRGITMPVYKLAGVYNPVFGDGSWGSEATYVAYYNEQLGDFKGRCVQWDLASNNDFDVTFEEEGTYVFESPDGIRCEWWGSELGKDLTADGTEPPNLGAEQHYDWFSKMPSFEVEVKKDVPVENIVLDKEALELYVNDTAKLTAVVMPENATNATVAWSSEDETVATVGRDGTVMAVNEGETVIIATAGEKSASCKVTVKKEVPEVPETPDNEPITLTDAAYGITLTGKGLSADMELIVTKLTPKDRAVDILRDAIPSTKGIFALCNIKLMEDGAEISLPEKAELQLPIGERYNGKTMPVLLHRDGKVTDLSGKVEEGRISVRTAQLGDFGVVVDMEADGAGPDGGTSSGNGKIGTIKTGDMQQVQYFIYAFAVGGVGIVGVALTRRRKGRK